MESRSQSDDAPVSDVPLLPSFISEANGKKRRRRRGTVIPVEPLPAVSEGPPSTTSEEASISEESPAKTTPPTDLIEVAASPVDSPSLTPAPRRRGPLLKLQSLLRKWIDYIEGQHKTGDHAAIDGFITQLEQARTAAYPWKWPWQRYSEEVEKKQKVLKLLDPEGILQDKLKYYISAVTPPLIFLVKLDAQVEKTRNRADADKERDIRAQVERILAKLYEPLKIKFEEYRKIKEAQDNSLRRCFQQFLTLEKEEHWIGDKLKKIAAIEASASTLLKESRKTLTAIDGQELDLPEGVRNVQLSQPSENEKKDFEALQKATDDVLKACEAVCRGSIEETAAGTPTTLEDLKNWLSQHESALLTLKVRYEAAKGEYQFLLNTNLGGFCATYHALNRELSELFKAEMSKDTETKGHILKVLQFYLSNESSDASTVGEELKNYFEQKNKTLDNFQKALKKLSKEVDAYNSNISQFKDKIGALDKKYKDLDLSTLLIWNPKRQKEQREKKFADKLKTSELRQNQDALQAYHKKIQDHKIDLDIVLEKIKRADARNESGIVERLQQMINQDACTLDTSNDYFTKKILPQLESKIGSIKGLIGVAETTITALNTGTGELKREASSLPEAGSNIISSQSAEVLRTQLARCDRQAKSDEPRLADIKEECERYCARYIDQGEGEFNKLFDQVALIKLSKDLFYSPLEELVSVFSSLSLPEMRKDDCKKIARVFDKSLISKYGHIRKKISDIQQHLSEYFPGLDEESSVDQFLKNLQAQFNDITGSAHILRSVTGDAFSQFAEYSKSLDWTNGGIETIDENSIQTMWSYIQARNDKIEALWEKRNVLFSDNDESLENLLVKTKEDFVARKGELDKHLDSLQIIVANIKAYLSLYELVMQRRLYFLEKTHTIEGEGLNLKQRDASLTGAIESVGRCLTQANDIAEYRKAANEARESMLTTLPLITGSFTERLQEAQDNLNKEKKYETDTFSLFKDISTFKQMKMSGFARLKREFLYAGKSSDIISQLYWHQVSRHHTPKGDCIGKFLEKLKDKNQLNSMDELKAYLDCPFGVNDPRNEQLFENTGWSNLGGKGRPSTTKRLINELRQELSLLEARELAARPGSIRHALEQDSRQIESEFQSILESKSIDGQSLTVKAAQQCEDMIEKYVSMQSPNTAQLQRSLIGIQCWDPVENITSTRLAQMRYDRMRCAEAILLGKSEAQEQLKKDHPEIYLYQEFCLHIEKCATKRLEKKAQIMVCLNNILCGSDIPAKKYENMLNAISGYYTAIRDSFNGSESYFFGSSSFFPCGKGSQLGDALESFLNRHDKNVLHRRQAKRLDAAAEWLSVNIFTCRRAP